MCKNEASQRFSLKKKAEAKKGKGPAQNPPKKLMAEGVYTIKNINSGMCAELPAKDEKKLSATIHQTLCNNGETQKWKLSYNKENYAILTSTKSNMVLSVDDKNKASAKNGTNIIQFTTKSSPTQLFTFKKENGGAFNIIVKESGKCVQVAGAAKNGGANIQQVNSKFYYLVAMYKRSRAKVEI